MNLNVRCPFVLVQNGLKFHNVFLPGTLGRIGDQYRMIAFGTGFEQRSRGIPQQFDLLDSIFHILVFVERVLVLFQINCGCQLYERALGIQYFPQ